MSQPLPIDSSRGFPQSFPLLFGGTNYRFSFYVNIAAELLPPGGGVLPMPDERAFLVMRVERAAADGTFQTLLVRKVTPGVDYFAGNLRLRFDEPRVARENLNGQGDFGSLVRGEVADRWA